MRDVDVISAIVKEVLSRMSAVENSKLLALFIAGMLGFESVVEQLDRLVGQ